MLDNNKKVVSGIVALTGAFVTPETAQATWNRPNSNSLIKTTRELSAVKEAAEALNRVKATKKAFEHVKRDAKKEINKAKNIRNDALRKVNQAEEIVEAAKEDWETKVIIADKKANKLESKLDKIGYITQAEQQVEQAIQEAENAKENFENKTSEAVKKRLLLQQYEENLEAVIQEKNTQIEAAEMAYKQAQTQQQQVIHRANNSNNVWGNLTKKYIIEDRLSDNSGFQALISGGRILKV